MMHGILVALWISMKVNKERKCPYGHNMLDMISNILG